MCFIGPVLLPFTRHVDRDGHPSASHRSVDRRHSFTDDEEDVAGDADAEKSRQREAAPNKFAQA